MVELNSQQYYFLGSLLLAYPISTVYSKYLTSRSKTAKLIYLLVFGLAIICFNYGLDVYHSLINCLFCYATLSFLSVKVALAVNFTATLLYLVVGCYLTQDGANYSLTWTIPQCVLTLKLIAISWDLYDGVDNRTMKKKMDNAQLVNGDTAIDSLPPLLEFLTHCYFPASVMCGPLISYRQFNNFIESNVNHWPKCWKIACTRLIGGVFYMAVFHFGSHRYPSDYLLSPGFSNEVLWMRMTTIAIVAKVAMCKYLASWLISEGACIASGVSWDGNSYYSCANIHVAKFETTPTFGGIIKSFNLTTNAFAAKYVYKRLKFLGNKYISQAATLLFLSIWHGIDTGYLITFSMEFMIMKTETEVIAIVNEWREKSERVKRIVDNELTQWLIYLVFRVYTIYVLGYAFAPMLMIKYRFWFPVLKQVYFYGHVINGLWLFVSVYLAL